ncbi:MAG: ABC transporter substrate-binding protein [Beijerinckiaceae bacterium]
MSGIRILSAAVSLLGACALSVLPAAAQKSKDTLRVGVYQPISVVDGVFDPHPQTNLMDRMVFDFLLTYDADQRKYMPGLAESWKRIDPLTMEFKLRKGVKFHDGSEFDADDVVYSFDFVTDPNVKFRFKDTTYGNIDKATKIDKYTVRVKTKKPFAAFESRLANSPPIFPSDYHSKLEAKNFFGRKPIGTGPYKAVEVTPSRVVLEKNPEYKHGNSGKPAGKIGRIEIAHVPDAQTQVARMMTGQQDLMYQVPNDIAQFLKQNPDIEITTIPSIQFIYFIPDAADRSGVGVFKDKRVRQAVMMGIDRKAIAKALLPKEIADMPLQKSMCHEWHVGCKATLSPPEYNVEKAKKLLAEAGHPNGFKLALTTWGPSVQTAEVVAGQLRKIGIDASVDKQSIGGFVKKRASGKVQAFVSLWDNGSGQPDVDSTAGFFYLPGSRNYAGDKALTKLVLDGKFELDLTKREATYQKLFDTVTAEGYGMPIFPIPAITAHTMSLNVPTHGTKKPEGVVVNRLSW